MNSTNRSLVIYCPIFVILGTLLVVGCDTAGGTGSASGSGAGGGQESKGFKLDWGNGSVEIGGDGSVDVQAPGVDVKRKPGEGVSVKAPNVDVQVAPGKGVQVKAPNVDVDVQPNLGSDKSSRVKVDAAGIQVDTNPDTDAANKTPLE